MRAGRAALLLFPTLAACGVNAVPVTPEPRAGTTPPPLAASAIASAIQDQSAAFLSCYRAVLSDHPKEKGDVVVRFALAGGAVESTEVLPTALADRRPQFAACIDTAFREISFADSDVADQTITYPLGFEPTPASPGQPGSVTFDRLLANRLPPPVIQQVVRRHFDQIRRCYEEALAEDASLLAKTSTRFRRLDDI